MGCLQSRRMTERVAANEAAAAIEDSNIAPRPRDLSDDSPLKAVGKFPNSPGLSSNPKKPLVTPNNPTAELAEYE